jgi:hypothetical protein
MSERNKRFAWENDEFMDDLMKDKYSKGVKKMPSGMVASLTDRIERVFRESSKKDSKKPGVKVSVKRD